MTIRIADFYKRRLIYRGAPALFYDLSKRASGEAIAARHLDLAWRSTTAWALVVEAELIHERGDGLTAGRSRIRRLRRTPRSSLERGAIEQLDAALDQAHQPRRCQSCSCLFVLSRDMPIIGEFELGDRDARIRASRIALIGRRAATGPWRDGPRDGGT